MMPALRLLGLIIIGGLVTIGVIADQRERTIEELPSPVVVTASDSRAGTWFCAGGSGSVCLLYTSPSPRDMRRSRMPSSA